MACTGLDASGPLHSPSTRESWRMILVKLAQNCPENDQKKAKKANKIEKVAKKLSTKFFKLLKKVFQVEVKIFTPN